MNKQEIEELYIFAKEPFFAGNTVDDLRRCQRLLRKLLDSLAARPGDDPAVKAARFILDEIFNPDGRAVSFGDVAFIVDQAIAEAKGAKDAEIERRPVYAICECGGLVVNSLACHRCGKAVDQDAFEMEFASQAAELTRLRGIVDENHDWMCGCGHWNGPNLAVCGCCTRPAGETARMQREAASVAKAKESGT